MSTKKATAVKEQDNEQGTIDQSVGMPSVQSAPSGQCEIIPLRLIVPRSTIAAIHVNIYLERVFEFATPSMATLPMISTKSKLTSSVAVLFEASPLLIARLLANVDLEAGNDNDDEDEDDENEDTDEDEEDSDDSDDEDEDDEDEDEGPVSYDLNPGLRLIVDSSNNQVLLVADRSAEMDLNEETTPITSFPEFVRLVGQSDKNAKAFESFLNGIARLQQELSAEASIMKLEDIEDDEMLHAPGTSNETKSAVKASLIEANSTDARRAAAKREMLQTKLDENLNKLGQRLFKNNGERIEITTNSPLLTESEELSEKVQNMFGEAVLGIVIDIQ